MRVPIEREISLFRYDLVRPYDSWSTNQHSIEYKYPNLPEIFRYKNQIGAFYFYFSKEQAINTAMVACRKRNQDKFWITETRLSPKLQLLDLRFRENSPGQLSELDTPLKIIIYLHDIGINILNTRFVKFNTDNDSIILTPLSVMKPLFDELNSIDAIQNKTPDDRRLLDDFEHKVNDFFHNKIGYFGQLLTDFTNGKAFKELLMNVGFDGYIFEEERATHVQTYCLFNVDHLAPPQSQQEAIHHYQIG